MIRNPFRYAGPLNPAKNEDVCVPRAEELKSISAALMAGSYYVIIGPRQIGKTTFLNQLSYAVSDAHFFYFDLSVSPSNEVLFFQLLVREVLAQHSAENEEHLPTIKDDTPAFSFLQFLKVYEPKVSKKKLIFIFEEFGDESHQKSLLAIWRKIFQDRNLEKKLERYSVVISGIHSLLQMTTEMSPQFTVAKVHYLKDFNIDQSRILTNRLKDMGVQFEREAEEHLLSMLNGHPQMLQHACYLLVEHPTKQGKKISLEDIDYTLQTILRDNSGISTLRFDVHSDENLKKLILDILDEKKVKYFPYSKYSFTGAGAIVEEGIYCSLRNKLYQEYLSTILGKSKELGSPSSKAIKRKILSFFEPDEQSILSNILKYLDLEDVKRIESIISAIDRGKISFEHQRETLSKVQSIASFLIDNPTKHNLSLPEDILEFLETIQRVDLELNVPFKFYLPIILRRFMSDRNLKTVSGFREAWDFMEAGVNVEV